METLVFLHKSQKLGNNDKTWVNSADGILHWQLTRRMARSSQMWTWNPQAHVIRFRPLGSGFRF